MREGIRAASVIPDERLSDLSRADIARYSRHLLLPEIGLEGQTRIRAARVLLVGTGGLGAPPALYLAAAGVGTLGLVDFDTVEASNLQRQVIHSTRDLGRSKVASAADRIRDLNPDVNVVPYDTRLTRANATDIIRDYDVVVDGTDNYQTRYLINDVCVLLGKPNVYGSVSRFEGQASVFFAPEGPCYRCLYPLPPPPGSVPSCAEAGVPGVLPGVIGTLQAAEVLKLIVGRADTLAGRLLLFDVWGATFRELRVEKDPGCPICGQNPSIRAPIDYERFCGAGTDADAAPVDTLTAAQLKARLCGGEAFQIIDIREPHEQAFAPFPGAKYIPLGRMARRVGEFDPDIPAVFLCKVGRRSVFAIQVLREVGYAGKMYNLRGGVNAWAREADETFPVY